MTNFRELCGELLDELKYQTDWSIAEELKERASAALAEPEPRPTENNSAELAADIRRFLRGYQQMRGLDPENIYSIHRGDALEAHLRVSQLARIAEILEAQ